MTRTLKNKIVYEQNINNIEGKAIAIVFPESVQEIKNIVKMSNHDIIARGSGTSLTGAVIPKNSIIIDFSRMNKIIEIDAAKKTAVVEPGVLLSELNEELEIYGLEFPIIPIFGAVETMGGMLAKNSSGNREIKYNRMINWADSLIVVDGKGEQVKVAKSDLSDFIGMEGTTGIIVQASIRLTGKKQRSITILRGNTLQEIFAVNRKLRLRQDICSLDLVNPNISSLLGLENKYHLFVEFDSSEGNFKEESYENYLKLKGKIYKKVASEGYIYISNAKFLIDSLQDFLIHLEERKIPYLSYLASGSVFTFFKQEQLGLMNESQRIAKKLRGRIAYNFGVGLTKKDALELGESGLLKRVKNRHDPNWKLNQDKLINYILPKEQKPEIKEQEQPKAEEQKPAEQKPILEETKKEEQPKPIEEIKKPEEKKPETVGDVLASAESITLRRHEPPISAEEREKIRKIAGGFFGGGATAAKKPDIKKEEPQQTQGEKTQ